MPVKIDVVKSERKDKRYKAIFSHYGKPFKTVHFGSASGRTYIDHHDKQIREAYIARHKGEDWNNLYSPGALSRYLLWGDSTDLETNIKKYNKKLNKNA